MGKARNAAACPPARNPSAKKQGFTGPGWFRLKLCRSSLMYLPYTSLLASRLRRNQPRSRPR